jgi:hypothetical protein
MDPFYPVPNLFRHRLLFSFRYRPNRVPDSPAFWYFKNLYKGIGTSVWVASQLRGCSLAPVYIQPELYFLEAYA